MERVTKWWADNGQQMVSMLGEFAVEVLLGKDGWGKAGRHEVGGAGLSG